MPSVINRFSASTDGLPIYAGTGATLVHTTPAGVISWDSVYLWVSNVDIVDRSVEVYFGNTSNRVVRNFTLSAFGSPQAVLVGQILRNNATVHVQSVAAANVIAAFGYVITNTP